MQDKYVHFASIQPKNIQVKNLESLYNNKNFFELIKYSEVFLNKFPESKFIYNLIGVSYFNLGKYSNAVENETKQKRSYLKLNKLLLLLDFIQET